jgi:hypothetical protein
MAVVSRGLVCVMERTMSCVQKKKVDGAKKLLQKREGWQRHKRSKLTAESGRKFTYSANSLNHSGRLEDSVRGGEMLKSIEASINIQLSRAVLSCLP